MRRNLHGSTVLITGASRGIGRRIALVLAKKGARLALTARSADELEAVAAECRALGAEAEAITADLTSPADRKTLVAKTVERFGGLDILINNAGVASFGEFRSSSEEIMRTIFEINFFAPVELTRLCIPHLTNSTRMPAVLNVASLLGRRGLPSYPEHCPSKFALAGLTECWRGELARFGIDALLLLPGIVKVDDRERHMLRFEGRIDLPFNKGVPPERVANAVYDALRRNRIETVVGAQAFRVWLGQRLMPWLVDGVLKRKTLRFEKRAGKN